MDPVSTYNTWVWKWN